MGECCLVLGIPKLNKRPPLNRTIDLADIPEAEIDQLLVFLLAQPSNEALACQLLPQSIGREPILRETEVEEGCHGDLGGAELFLLFHEVGAADETDGHFVTEGREELKHLRGGILAGRSIDWAD